MNSAFSVAFCKVRSFAMFSRKFSAKWLFDGNQNQGSWRFVLMKGSQITNGRVKGDQNGLCRAICTFWCPLSRLFIQILSYDPDENLLTSSLRSIS